MSFVDQTVAERSASTYMFMGCIAYINKVTLDTSGTCTYFRNVFQSLVLIIYNFLVLVTDQV